MRKVKFFSCKLNSNPDVAINEFIVANPGIEIIDVKCAGVMPGSSTEGPKGNLGYFLVIYEESSVIEK